MCGQNMTKLYVKLNAIYKLGSSPIGCDDFQHSHAFPEVSQMGYRYRVVPNRL